MKRVVAAHADDEMCRVARQPIQLPLDAGRHAAINCTQCGAPTLRQPRAELPHDVRAACDISGIIENGITEQNYVAHAFWRCAQVFFLPKR